jgi:hypothetical protein
MSPTGRSGLFQLAFTFTAFALVCLVAGTIGYNLSRHPRFVNGTAWSDTVIWWEIGLGAAVLPLAVYFWRKALRSLGASERPKPIAASVRPT